MMAAHCGVYALILWDSGVLLFRKTGGPYDGLLDLPGGAPLANEPNRETTLAREVDEETGLRLTGLGTWFPSNFSSRKIRRDAASISFTEACGRLQTSSSTPSMV